MNYVQQARLHKKLLLAHIAYVEEENGAEFYNLGWAQGEDFIHSKTTKGRLFSEIDLNTGEITHEWTSRVIHS